MIDRWRRCASLLAVGWVVGCGGGGVEGLDPPAGGTGGGLAQLGVPEGGSCVGAECVCLSGSGSCADGKATMCRSDGRAVVSFDCDATQGMVCTPSGCTGACSPTELQQSYIGCDYYPTVTLNPVWSGFDFAVAVGNTGNGPASVTITRGAAAIDTRQVASGAIEIFKLPWVADLKGGDVDACQNPPDVGATRLVKAGAYRLRSNQPVTVYQFSPLQYGIDPAPAACPVGTQCPGGKVAQCQSYSNDASLLFPASVLTGNYTVLAWPSNGNRAGFAAITATEDGTNVRLVGSGPVMAGAGIDATGSGELKLDAGDVLEVVAAYDPSSEAYGADISGTLVRASKPIQVIGGHSCARVPTATTGYCDHLEQALFPEETLGKDYIVTYPAAVGDPSPHVIRIQAVKDATHLKFDPALAPETTLAPGDPPLQLTDVTRDVRIEADQPILVAQYMEGSTAVPSRSGDPSLSLAIPSAQFRTSYRFVASSTYDASFINIIVPSRTNVTLDGQLVGGPEFSSVGASGFSVAHRELSRTDFHSITADAAFGIVVYGYGKDTSYMYPGGLDLRPISVADIR